MEAISNIMTASEMHNVQKVSDRDDLFPDHVLIYGDHSPFQRI